MQKIEGSFSYSGAAASGGEEREEIACKQRVVFHLFETRVRWLPRERGSCEWDRLAARLGPLSLETRSAFRA